MLIAVVPPQLKIKAENHWISFLGPTLCAAFFSIAIMGQCLLKLSGYAINYPMLILMVISAYLPLVIRYIQIRNRSYIISPPLLEVQDGVLRMRTNEIPLSKINNIVVDQSVLEKLVGAGSLTIFTGNDQAVYLQNISNPSKFKTQIRNFIK